LLAEFGGIDVEEKGGEGAASETPDDVGGGAIVPTGYFGDYTNCFVWLGYVGAEVVEALRGVFGCGLEDFSIGSKLLQRWSVTLIS
jgi:hypothetical protein